MATLMLCLAGCNSKKEKDSTEAYDSLKPAALERMDLNIYTYGGTVTSNGKDVIEAMLTQIEPATAETIHVTPHFFWISPERYDAEIKKLVSSGEKIDAFTCYSPKAFVDQGLCMELTELFKQHAPVYSQELAANNFGKEYLSDCSVDGKLYAIPYNAVNNPRYGIVTRAELAEKYAPEGIETLEDYGVFLKKVKENEKDTYPAYVVSSVFFTSYLQGNGYFSEKGDFLFSRWDENGKNLYTLDQTPEFINAYELLLDWKTKGFAVPNIGKQNFYGMFNGVFASYLTPMNQISNSFESVPDMQVQLKVIPLYMESLHLLNASAWGIAVAENCPNPERVLMFVDWIHSSQKNYDLFTHGVEGTNYKMEGENLTFPRGEVRPLDTWKYFGAGFFQDFRYERIIPVFDPNFRQVYQESGTRNVKTYAQLRNQRLKTMNETKIEQMEKEYDQVQGIVAAYYRNIQSFSQSIDSGNFRMTVEELREKQKEAGIDKVLEVYRKYFAPD
jgi:putative aldouronate transport system substrate-binding protein